MNAQQICEQLCIGTQTVVPKDALTAKLQTGRPLLIKLGMDPTAPDLHLGHAVVLTKMRQFQDLGHTCVFLIGDFTARIGDPTGRSKTRPPLTSEQIIANTKTYFEQVSRILDADKTVVRYNSEWLDAMSINDMLKLCAKITLARIIEREDFAKRLETQQPIGMHELMYPLMQGYDSVALKADVELGGSDQTFNLLCGRFLQEQYNQEPQVIMTTPLLEGIDGVQKMSKSYGNAIGLTESAEQAFGKLMSISDDLMWRYAHLLLAVDTAALETLKQGIAAGTHHPMDAKKHYAQLIVTKFWSADEAHKARAAFEAVFQQRDYTQATEKPLPGEQTVWIVELLKYLQVVASSSEARRLIESGAVQVDGESVKEFNAQIALRSGMIIKAGKHKIFRLV